MDQKAKILNNRYEQCEKLGVGGFSKVYKVKILSKKKDFSLDSMDKNENLENVSNENLNTMNVKGDDKKLTDKPLYAAAKKMKTTTVNHIIYI